MYNGSRQKRNIFLDINAAVNGCEVLTYLVIRSGRLTSPAVTLYALR